jgi:hypothetical protein
VDHEDEGFNLGLGKNMLLSERRGGGNKRNATTIDSGAQFFRWANF